MSPELWEQVPLSTKWREVEGSSLLFYSDGGRSAYLATPTSLPAIQKNRWSEPEPAPITTLHYARTDRSDDVGMLEMPPEAPIGPKVRDLVGPGGKAVLVPPIRWSSRDPLPQGRVPWTVVVFLVVAVALIFTPVGVAGALPGGGLAALLAWLIRTKPAPTRLLNPGEYDLDAGNIVEYTKMRQAGESPALTMTSDRRAAAMRRMDGIRAEYGELMTDIVYRIDYPALFDPSVPSTQRLDVAMMRLDGAESASLLELESLVNELEIAYSAARDNAETLGDRHLPETARDAARRASKAANLAVHAATEGERAASLAQVKRILDSLALHYLPTLDPETLAIESAPRLEP